MVDGDIVIDKLRHINEYTADLKQMRGMAKEEYLNDVVYDVLHSDLHWFE
jgi:hypothetical protein